MSLQADYLCADTPCLLHYLEDQPFMMAASVRKCLGLASAFLSIVACTLNTTGCSPSENHAASQAMSLLNTFIQNKTLAEQFVRDIKADVDPSEPVYSKLLESYDEAKSSYDRLLDELEAPGSHHGRSIRPRLDGAKRKAEESMATFLDTAAHTLRPTVSFRSAELKTVAALPDDLAVVLESVPKAERARYAHDLDSAVRWRSWNEL